MISKHIFILTILSFSVFFSSGCATKHIGVKEDRAMELSVESSSSLYSYSSDNINSYTPKSGFYPLENEFDALSARILLCQSAQKHISVQYFTFHADGAGTFLTKALFDAASRGVKIDILIDDMAISYDDAIIGVLNTHPNITIRVFNPTNSRRALHYVEMGIYSDTVGRRMHNKSFVADNSMAIYGGRNIGDDYFATNPEFLFVDNDILVAGPLVNKITNQFRYYFSNALSVDFDEISKGSKEELVALQKEFDTLLTQDKYMRLNRAVLDSSFAHKFSAKKLPLHFGNVELYYDMPQKITTDINNTVYNLNSAFPKKIIAKSKFYMTAPYFIPNEHMMNRLQKLVKNGVDVALLTNSLASSDTTSVYAYYAESQKRLLEMGVRLYELRPDAFRDKLSTQEYKLEKLPVTSLHAKTIVIDDDIFIIGSANMDPRSRNLNTEIVSIVQNRELNAHEQKVFKLMSSLENSYALELEYDENNESTLVWKTMIDSEIKSLYNDADASIWLRIKKNLSLWFPIRDFL